jgi:flagellar basal-body rod protein FlgC
MSAAVTTNRSHAMSDISNVALSGLQAASRRLEVSARNVVNADSVGTPKATTDARVPTPAYQPERVVQTSVSGGGVETRTQPVQPATRTQYRPDHPAAGSDGLVDAPNVDLAVEVVEQISARTAYEASAKVIQTADGLLKSLLDLKT